MTLLQWMWSGSHRARRALACCAIALAFSAGSTAQTALLVDDDAPGGGDGSSWTAAFNNLQHALDAAANLPGQQVTVRVAQGNYVPTKRTDPGDPRSVTFQLLNNVTLEGGYAGLGTANPDARDPDTYVSTLDGRFSGNTSAYHVLIGSGTDHTAVLDGFKITRGASSDAAVNRGGGLLNISGSPTIQSCVFMHNSAMDGGAVSNLEQSNPTIRHCKFTSNSASLGGAIHNEDFSSPSITFCQFTSNNASKGGAMYSYNGSSPAIEDCDFLGNAASQGAALRYFDLSSALIRRASFIANQCEAGTIALGASASTKLGSCYLHECLFEGNIAEATAGGVQAGSAWTELTDCVFRNNRGSIGAGAVSMSGGGLVEKCLFYDNAGGVGAGAILLGGHEQSYIVRNCDFARNRSTYIGGALTCMMNTAIGNCSFSNNDSPQGGAVAVTKNATFSNCSLSSNPRGGITIVGDGGAVSVSNSILWGNSLYQVAVNVVGPPQPPDGSEPIDLDFCNIQGGWDGPGSNNIDVNPLFLQPGCDNLRLAHNSPCLDAGSNALVPAGITIDLDGNPRIQNGIVDMGAYEGGHDPLPPAACASNIYAGDQVRLIPTGGAYNPVQRAVADLVNQGGPDQSSAMATQFDLPIHPAAGGFNELGDALQLETSIADGDLLTRVTIPFDQSELAGFDPITVDLTFFNAQANQWMLAAMGNVQNSPGHSGPLGDRIVVQNNSTNFGMTWDVGDYGVFWNPELQRGFAWAVVDHASEFAFGVPLPLCTGDCAFPANGTVDLADVYAVLDAWGLTPPGPASFADINRDGVVDIDDLLEVISAWGPCS